MRNDEKTNEFWKSIPKYNINDFEVYKNFSLEMLETFGSTNHEISFEYLARF